MLRKRQEDCASANAQIPLVLQYASRRIWYVKTSFSPCSGQSLLQTQAEKEAKIQQKTAAGTFKSDQTENKKKKSIQYERLSAEVW